MNAMNLTTWAEIASFVLTDGENKISDIIAQHVLFPMSKT